MVGCPVFPPLNRGLRTGHYSQAPIHPSSWKKNSRKFAVASGLSTQWQVLDNRPWRTPLGSKRLRLGSSSCTSLYQGVVTRSGATTREILVHRAGPLQTHTTP